MEDASITRLVDMLRADHLKVFVSANPGQLNDFVSLAPDSIMPRRYCLAPILSCEATLDATRKHIHSSLTVYEDAATRVSNLGPDAVKIVVLVALYPLYYSGLSAQRYICSYCVTIVSKAEAPTLELVEDYKSWGKYQMIYDDLLMAKK